MLVPCEVGVKTVSPAIRAVLAKMLIQEHQMKETQVAQTLGVTQSAVSKYFKNVRGTTIPLENAPELQPILAQMIGLLLAPQPLQTGRQMEMMTLFCQACTTIRTNGLMCSLCQKNMKTPVQDCTFCRNTEFCNQNSP